MNPLTLMTHNYKTCMTSFQRLVDRDLESCFKDLLSTIIAATNVELTVEGFELNPTSKKKLRLKSNEEFFNLSL